MADLKTPTTPTAATSSTTAAPSAKPATSKPMPTVAHDPAVNTPASVATSTPPVSPEPVGEKHSSPIVKVLIVAFVVIDLLLVGYILYRGGMLPLG